MHSSEPLSEKRGRKRGRRGKRKMRMEVGEEREGRWNKERRMDEWERR